MTFADTLDALGKYPSAVKKAIMQAEGTEDLVDLLAVLRSNRSKVWDYYKQGSSELETGDTGHQYTVKVSKAATRSYNTSSLLLKFGTAFNKPMLETLKILMAHEVITISWSWTNLKKTIRLYDIPMVIVQHEITDGDPDADVGEVWKNQSVTFDKKEEHADTAG